MIKPDPCGVSRHVRVLILGGRDMHTRPLLAPDIKASLPHLTSLKNLRELIIDHPDTAHASLDVLTPIFSSSPGILKLHWWTRLDVDIHEFWKDISTLADLLPNLTLIGLSDCQSMHSEVQVSVDQRCSLANKRFEFHQLRIVFTTPLSLPLFGFCAPQLQILDLSAFQICYPVERWPSPSDHRVKRLLITVTLIDPIQIDVIQAFRTLLEACHTLQVLNFGLFPRTAQFLGSIPSSSIHLVQISNPFGIGDAPMTYSDSWPWGSFEEFEHRRSCMDDDDLAVFADLGFSIRKIAQRYSDHHSGLKTRVRATLCLTESEIQAVEDGEVPFYKTRLEEELGGHVVLDFELISVADLPGLELVSDTELDG